MQDYIVGGRGATGVPVIDNTDMRSALDALIELVLASAERYNGSDGGHRRAVCGRDGRDAAGLQAVPLRAVRARDRGGGADGGSLARACRPGGGEERDAAEAMRRVLDDFPIDGRVVIGSTDEESPLYVGGTIGAGGEQADLALDPLEGRGVVARGGNGAMSMIAVGERDSLLNLPDMYMRKLAVGPRARGSIDLLKPMGENVQAIADAFGRRQRHHDDRPRPAAPPRPDRGHPRRRAHGSS